MKKKVRGRPLSKNPATARLPTVRVTPQQLQAYNSASELAGEPLAAWVKRHLDAAARRDSKRGTPGTDGKD